MAEGIKIIAAVKFNKSEAYVLNRRPIFEYTREGSILYAYDGGFFKTYKHEPYSDRWKAFGGAKFDIPLLGGGVEKAYGQWWDAGGGQMAKHLGVDLVDITFEALSELKNCYVFTGSLIDKPALVRLRDDYQGPVFEFYDYEKIIKYDAMRHKLWDDKAALERKSRAVIKEAKKWKSLYDEIRKVVCYG